MTLSGAGSCCAASNSAQTSRLVHEQSVAVSSQLRISCARAINASTSGSLRAARSRESECCAFLAMRVEEASDQVRVNIDAPDGAELVLEELVAAFESAPRAA